MKTEKVNYKKRNSKFKCFFALLMAFSLVLQLPGVSSITMAGESTNGNSSSSTREGNKIPTITSNAEETDIAPNNKEGETIDPVFFVMGLPTTGTSSDGSKNADPIVNPLTLTGKDSDGTINGFFNYDGNLHELGASDLTFTKEPAVFPGDPQTSTGVLKIAGKFSHEPGGLYTRFLKVVDNGGEAFQYRYKIIGYTDSLINTNPIVKEQTDSVSDAEIYSRLALEIKSSKFSTITDQFQNYFRNAFGDKYGVRTIVGYKKSNENNYNNETSVTSIVDKSGTYDVKVKTTNPWGQAVYNVVQIQFNAPPIVKMSEQFDPKSPVTKVPVADPANLTDTEKEAVKKAMQDANKDLNPKLPENTTFEVGKDGTVTVKYPDGTTDTIQGSNVVKKSVASEYNLILPDQKVIVKNPKALTTEEKAAVREAVTKANPNPPSGITISVGDDGKVTVTYRDNSVDTIEGSEIVVQADSEKYKPVAPSTKVSVTEPTNLTTDEKEAVKKAVEDANKNLEPKLPEKTEIEVGNDGTVTVKYPDGTTDTIQGKDVVKKSDAAAVTPVAPKTKVPVADPTNLTETEKEAVKKAIEDANKNLDPKLPDGTKLEVGNDGTVTVKYPDGTMDTIPGTEVVKKSLASETNVVVPSPKIIVKDPKNLTSDEKTAVSKKVLDANPNLPRNTTITVGDDGKVTITYNDNSVDTIDGSDIVVQAESEKYKPVAPSTKVSVTEPTNLTNDEKEAVKKAVEDANKNLDPKLPDGTKFEVGDDGTVTVKYPDGSTDTIPGTDVVKKSDAATNNPVAPDNKVPVTDPKALTPGEKKSVEEAIKKKNPTLPENTEITVGNDGTVTVKYPDGSTDTIPGTDVVRKYYYNPSSSGSSSNSNTSNSDRLNGKDRVETAVKVSRASYPYGARAVILANKDKFPDVLTAVPFSVQIGAPILFTNTDSLPKETIDEIARLNPSMVYINGGEHSVSMSIEQLMKKQGRSVHRFNGVDRYDTARLIGEKIRERGNKKVVEIASGETFPDALSISSLAVKENAPILLSKRNDLTISTKSALASWDVEKVTIAGQTATISNAVESSVISGFNTGIANTDSIFSGSKNTRRIGGADRYETSALIAKYAVPESKLGVYTSGEVFADALVAGPYAGLKNAPVLLVSKNNVPSSIANYTKTSKIDRAVVVGGASTVYDSTFDMIKSLIKR
ncbi:MAG: cell wall-binding repeat-containing protein [Peptostreptococcus porci]|uniref:cell wall-binding repeat-containing protein n=1 Tax=Peptostreptococcus porci TaxID=2652282 RepID=UPI002A919F75|nr:cell wall-binding repeat-containing protein [Peptostreptococcus porci]MDY5480440.1 cell wall-binding repeat-containing protein [Peptostreptococcus porci]